MRTEPVIVSNPTIVLPAEPVSQQVTSQSTQPAVPSTSSGISVADNKENKTKTDQQLKLASSDSKVTSISTREVSSTPDECDEFFDASTEEAMASSSSTSSHGEVPGSNADTMIGSESWHREVPSSWIPIISADIDLQRRTGGNVHEPLSEAYLNVLPKKKRKTGE